MTTENDPLNIDPETLGLFREPLTRALNSAEEMARRERGGLGLGQVPRGPRRCGDDGAHRQQPRRAPHGRAGPRPGGVANINRVLSPSKMRLASSCHQDTVCHLTLKFDPAALVRKGSFNLHCHEFGIRANDQGAFFVSGTRETFNTVAETVAHIEGTFGVSFTDGTETRTPTVTYTEVVLPPELKRYEQIIRDAITTAVPVNAGVTVGVRTKKVRAPKPATATTPAE